MRRDDVCRVRKRIKQSNLLVISDNPQAINQALASILRHRAMLESYIRTHPEFELALDPVIPDRDAPKIVQVVTGATRIARVGPMAAVAGSLAELAMEAMLSTGSRINLVENGGEISASSISPLTVGIYAGRSVFSERVGFILSPSDFPIGVATSSATVSHALNFGEADAAVAVADTASMADAVAKAACNAVRGDDCEASVQSGLETVERIGHVRGALIIRDDYMGTTGRLPRLARVNGKTGEMLEASLLDLVPPNVTML
jgi:ApbE superfamily uncharacterized protein (UPF0280 family)